MNNLYFKYAGNIEDVNFYEYMNSKEFLIKLKIINLNSMTQKKKQKELLNKINEVKIGRKTPEQEKVITNLENFYKSREEVFDFFKDYTKMMLDSGYKAKQDETKGTGLKIVIPKQLFQTLPIALVQVKAGNNS